jgi:hypothetical protein
VIDERAKRQRFTPAEVMTLKGSFGLVEDSSLYDERRRRKGSMHRKARKNCFDELRSDILLDALAVTKKRSA